MVVAEAKVVSVEMVATSAAMLRSELRDVTDLGLRCVVFAFGRLRYNESNTFDPRSTSNSIGLVLKIVTDLTSSMTAQPLIAIVVQRQIISAV